jgi:hypothetical protein
MAKVQIHKADNGVLWHITFAPFVDQRIKEKARNELRKRGAYSEPIIEKRAEER